jgi:hypothetical protein
MTFEASRNATSSPASLDGLPLFAWLDGLTTNPSGPAPVPASHSVRPESSAAPTTSATCGPSFVASSRSAALQSSLASRLQARLAGRGSPLFALTWKTWDMQSGPPICALRASALRTSGSGSGGWPSAGAKDGSKSVWTLAGAEKEAARKGWTNDLCAAALSSWPTASARDWKSSASNMHGQNARPLNEVARLAAWRSPTKGNGDRGGQDAMERIAGGHTLNLQDQVTLAHGTTSPGSPAATEKPGQLNPAFSRWLMGYPSSWDQAAPSKANRGSGC